MTEIFLLHALGHLIIELIRQKSIRLRVAKLKGRRSLNWTYT